MSQRRLLPILGPITAVIKNKSQNPGHQRSDLVHAKSADVVQFENVTASSDFPSQKSGQRLSLETVEGFAQGHLVTVHTDNGYPITRFRNFPRSTSRTEFH